LPCLPAKCYGDVGDCGPFEEAEGGRARIRPEGVQPAEVCGRAIAALRKDWADRQHFISIEGGDNLADSYGCGESGKANSSVSALSCSNQTSVTELGDDLG